MKKIHLLVSMMFILWLIACRSPEHDHHSHDSGVHVDYENMKGTTLTREQMESIDLKLGPIEQKQLTSSLKATGFLKVPNQNKANATAVLGGVVTSILVQTGNVVRKGQSLVTISNPAFITLQEEYLTVTETAKLAELELNRQKELQQGNANALKNVQQAETELRTQQTRKASLKKQLELIGIKVSQLSPDNMQSTISITSPIQGSVSDIMVNMGSYVDANTAIAEIVDHSQLHLDLYIFEKDLNKLKVGQTIHFTLTNDPGKEYDAKVFGISNTFEPETRAIAVHAAVQGNKQGLIDGMSITAAVSLDQATFDAVPTSSIVNYQGQDFIFIKTPTNTSTESVTFEKVPIRKGTSDIGYSEITLLKDIPKDAEVVINGAFFLMAKMTNEGQAHSH